MNYAMACFKPLTAYRAPPGYQLSGSNFGGISFDPRCSDIPGVEELKIPCGRCIGCRLEKSRQWAMRIVLEQQLHDQSCFITLTYNEDNLPKGGSLCQDDMTLFLKRLRKWIDTVHPGKRIRYFYCGEYGAKSKRPHYHLCLFGYDFSDREKIPVIGYDGKPKVLNGVKQFKEGKYLYKSFYKYTENGDALWISKKLQDIWGKGYCPFGALTFDSAAYTARYILKKVNGPIADDHYKGRKPEFICMSRMPGIGASWLEKYSQDIYSKDYINLRNGLKARPPKYFDRLYKAMHEPVPNSGSDVTCEDFVSPDIDPPAPEYLRFIELKKRRKEYALANPDNSPERLRQREEVAKLLTTNIYKRRYEESVV